VTVVFCCDTGRVTGLGHLMRCVALAEEVAGRGVPVAFVADLADLPWAQEQLAARNMPWSAPSGDPTNAVLRHSPRAVVLDSYLLPAGVSARLRAAGPTVLAIVDGDTRGQTADVYLDQNLGAEDDSVPVPGVRLAGLRYALHRRDILAHRPPAPRAEQHEVPSVLAFFGGTDAYGAAPVLAGALAAAGPAEATVVAATERLAEAVRAVSDAEVIGPTNELPRRIAAADLVVAASGTSAWELACLGAAAALVCVVDNQETGYARAVATGAVAGLGRLTDLRADPAPAVATLRRLLADPGERNRLRAAAWHLVDGGGARRVADALLPAGGADATAIGAGTVQEV
jgi:spore coat polysaccharide biosynthesis predicted glycosyltransferase SpsG